MSLSQRDDAEPRSRDCPWAPLLTTELTSKLADVYRIFAIPPSAILANLVPGDTVDAYVPLTASQQGTQTNGNATATYTAPTPYAPIVTAVTVIAILSPQGGGFSSGGTQIEIEVPPEGVSKMAAVAGSSQIVLVFASPRAKPVPVIQGTPHV